MKDFNPLVTENQVDDKGLLAQVVRADKLEGNRQHRDAEESDPGNAICLCAVSRGACQEACEGVSET